MTLLDWVFHLSACHFLLFLFLSVFRDEATEADRKKGDRKKSLRFLKAVTLRNINSSE